MYESVRSPVIVGRQWGLEDASLSEWEAESDEFFGRLLGWAKQATASPTLRSAASRAVRAVKRAATIGRIINLALHPLPEPVLPPKRDPIAIVHEPRRSKGKRRTTYSRYETADWETGLVFPPERNYVEALMEHLGRDAMKTDSEAESEALLGALPALAARLFPGTAGPLLSAAPGLIRGVAAIGRSLRADPRTRPLVRTVPSIVRLTSADLARQARHRAPVTPQGALRQLARRTAGVLRNPRRSALAYRRSLALDAQYRRAAAEAARGPRRPWIRGLGRGTGKSDLILRQLMNCRYQVLNALNSLVNAGDFQGAQARISTAIACLGRLPAGAPWSGVVHVAVAALTNARVFASPGSQGHAVTHLRWANQALAQAMIKRRIAVGRPVRR